MYAAAEAAQIREFIESLPDKVRQYSCIAVFRTYHLQITMESSVKTERIGKMIFLSVPDVFLTITICPFSGKPKLGKEASS